MADEKGKVNPSGTDVKPKEPQDAAPDTLDTPTVGEVKTDAPTVGEDKAAAPDKPPVGDKGKVVTPPKTEKPQRKQREARPPDGSKTNKKETVGGGTVADKPPEAPAVPEPPKDAPRSNVKEEIVQIPHAELLSALC